MGSFNTDNKAKIFFEILTRSSKKNLNFVARFID